MQRFEAATHDRSGSPAPARVVSHRRWQGRDVDLVVSGDGSRVWTVSCEQCLTHEAFSTEELALGSLASRCCAGAR